MERESVQVMLFANAATRIFLQSHFIICFSFFSYFISIHLFFNILRHSFAQRVRAHGGSHFCGRLEHCVHHTKFYYVAKFDVNQYPAIALLTHFFFVLFCSALSTSSFCSTFLPNNSNATSNSFLLIEFVLLCAIVIVLRYFIVNFIGIFLSFSFCVSLRLLFLSASALVPFNFSRNASFEVGNFTIGTKIDCEESHCKRCASIMHSIQYSMALWNVRKNIFQSMQ